jgi:hypothetical protein
MLWTVAQAVTWIAFGKITNWDEIISWSHHWPLQPPDDLLEPLRAITHGVGLNKFDPAVAYAAQRIVRDSGKTAAALARALRADLGRSQELAAKIGAALNDLQRAAEAHKLKVYAVQKGANIASRIPIDPDLFTRFPMSIKLYGHIGPTRPGIRYGGPHFDEAAVDQNEVQKMWPRPSANLEQLVVWMTKEAEEYLAKTGSKATQSYLAYRCATETGCKLREANIAHRRLPARLRRVRGEREVTGQLNRPACLIWSTVLSGPANAFVCKRSPSPPWSKMRWQLFPTPMAV